MRSASLRHASRAISACDRAPNPPSFACNMHVFPFCSKRVEPRTKRSHPLRHRPWFRSQPRPFHLLRRRTRFHLPPAHSSPSIDPRRREPGSTPTKRRRARDRPKGLARWSSPTTPVRPRLRAQHCTQVGARPMPTSPGARRLLEHDTTTRNRSVHSTSPARTERRTDPRRTCSSLATRPGPVPPSPVPCSDFSRT